MEYIVWLILFALIAMGVPLFASLGISAFIVLSMSVPLEIIPLDLYKVSEMFPLIAIPGFILAGSIMEKGGVSNQIVEVFTMIVGKYRGGLGIVTILGCVFFAAMIGSGPATVAAMGSVMIPSMVKHGYSKEYSAAVSSTGGTLGILIPPSNPLIIYGVIGNVSISSLFAAGFIPGLFVATSLILTAYFIARKHNFKGTDEHYTNRQIIKTLLTNIWSLLTPVIILGGIYAGIFTPVEASIIAVLYASFVSVFITREINLRSFWESLNFTSTASGTILVIVAVSILFGRFLTMYQVPQKLADTILNISEDPFVVLLIIILVLFVLGMFMETLATIVIIVPVLLPLITELGIDPIHFGILIVMTNEVALLTPPLGVNLFVAQSITDLSVEKIAKSVIPYIIILIICILIVAKFERIATFLPDLFFS